MDPLKSTPIWDDRGEGEGAEIAGIAVNARDRRDRKSKNLPLIHGKPGQISTDATDRNKTAGMILGWDALSTLES
jgi:hypothetical protein